MRDDRAPVGSHWIADRQSAPLLLRYGTEAQRLAFLPGIAKGEIFFGIGMSEPDAGSDLAAIRTRAVKVAGGYEISGTKIWTSYAHEWHFAITLVRTAPAEGGRHEGLSQLILDLKSPGVTIRPIITLAGEHDFNEMVLDQVFVPASRLVGERRRGLAPGHERIGFRAQRARALSQLLSAARGARAPRRPRSRGANRRGSRAHGGASQNSAAHVALDRRHAAGGRNPQPRSSTRQGSRQRFRAQDPRTRAPRGAQQWPRRERPVRASVGRNHPARPSWTLRGGTPEILRGIIARGLGLR